MTDKSHSILVVDDDQDTCQNLFDILTDLGYDVDVAYDGPTALTMVRRKPYDVALLDLKMPGMDGLMLYREIRKVRAGTVAMIVTAYATSATAEAALEAGAWKVLSKPVDFSQLLPLVDEAARQPFVLVVDDDHDLCSNLWDLLRDRDFRVCVAHDEQEAAERLRGRDYGVVIIDMKLPDADGRQVFELVRRSNPEARTILITGFRSELEQLIRQTLDEGADAVCYKPFDVPRLIEMVENLSHEH
jgi:DNA-binding response OmpR family regulator